MVCGMPQLTPEERTFLTGHLTQTRDVLLSEVANLSPDQWTFRPDEESWSIAECADHVVSIEKRILSLVSKRMQGEAPNPERAAEVQRKTAWLMDAVPSRHDRIKVPAGIENTSNSATPEDFIKLFEQRRAAVLEYVGQTQDPLHDRVSPHIVFKDLDGCQWLLLISLHSQRHTAQIVEVKKHQWYPK
jgi:hypothetical protein